MGIAVTITSKGCEGLSRYYVIKFTTDHEVDPIFPILHSTHKVLCDVPLWISPPGCPTFFIIPWAHFQTICSTWKVPGFSLVVWPGSMCPEQPMLFFFIIALLIVYCNYHFTIILIYLRALIVGTVSFFSLFSAHHRHSKNICQCTSGNFRISI